MRVRQCLVMGKDVEEMNAWGMDMYTRRNVFDGELCMACCYLQWMCLYYWGDYVSVTHCVAVSCMPHRCDFCCDAHQQRLQEGAACVCMEAQLKLLLW